MTADDGAQFLTTEEVAELLGMSERTVRLHAERLGGTRGLNARAWRFDRAQLGARAAAAGFKVPAALQSAGKE